MFPESVNDMKEKMYEMITDAGLRSSLVDKGRENTGKYNWEKTAQITYETFDKYL